MVKIKFPKIKSQNFAKIEIEQLCALKTVGGTKDVRAKG